MLNGTLCATERTLCCLLENYQTDKGVRVPEVLIPYMKTDFIPYVEELLPGYVKPKKEGKEGGKKDVVKKEGGKKDEVKKDAKVDEQK
jgi:seryl-tRNA synthetase